MLAAPLLLSLAASAAQTAAAPPQAVEHHSARMFISPMGEPFRPRARDDDGLADWFNQADANHDGRLTLEEMQQDADRFFATFDVDHDGEIGPDEITRYEDVVAPEIRVGHVDMAGFADGAGRGQRGGGRGGHHRASFASDRDNDPHQGAGRYGLLDLPEPVISADSDFNRGVSRSEFEQAAGQRFLARDVDHRGYQTLAGLEATHPAPPAAPKPPPRPADPDESALPDGG
jgi:hypothetical protein